MREDVIMIAQLNNLVSNVSETDLLDTPGLFFMVQVALECDQLASSPAFKEAILSSDIDLSGVTLDDMTKAPLCELAANYVKMALRAFTSIDAVVGLSTAVRCVQSMNVHIK